MDLPAPQIIIAEIILVILAIALGRPERWVWAIVVGLLALAVSATGETRAVVILALLALVSLARGVQVVRSRRVLRGAILIVLAIPLAGTGPAFRGWPPLSGLYEREFRDLVAYQIHAGKKKATIQGTPRYEAPGREKNGRVKLKGIQIALLRWESDDPGPYAIDYRQDPASRSFETWLVPHRLPSFPYNHLVSLPTFYGDQTGAIRRTDVSNPGDRCPLDAPIIYQVDEGHLEDIAVRIRSASGPR